MEIEIRNHLWDIRKAAKLLRLPSIIKANHNESDQQLPDESPAIKTSITVAIQLKTQIRVARTPSQ